MRTLRARHLIFSAASALTIAGTVLGCQDYPFELREPSRVNATEITEVVAQLTPADILFVIDNSGSMDEEITELQNNIALFLDTLTLSDIDFQIGIITTDMECNVPSNDCDQAVPTTSVACCQQLSVNPGGLCEERDQDVDGVVDVSTCDGGRLRSGNASGTGRRVFPRPDASERDAWIAEVNQAIDLARNNLNGSTMEAGLSAVVEAVACAVGDPECSDPAIADLNSGFVREGADLVVIFVTDEDDCSVTDPAVYRRPPDIMNPLDQRTHFCSALDCYAYYGAVDSNANMVNDFIDEGMAGGPTSGLLCDDGTKRSENPPGLSSVSTVLDSLVALKGDVGAVRGAGILSATPDPGADLGFSANGCFNRTTGPSADCGCLANSPLDAYCYVTERNGQNRARLPVGSGGSFSGGCSAMPGGRYAQFLSELGSRRLAALQQESVLVDSICRDRYDETLEKIVVEVILSSCFGLGGIPGSVSDLLVTYNGSTLPNVEPDGAAPGWSWIEGSSEICLEGGLSKSVNDRVEIVLLEAGEVAQ
ncbi:MAG: vWA domain-containing protein [Myxococcota bacterium]